MAKSTRRKAGKTSGLFLGVLLIVVGMASAAYWVTRSSEPVKLPDAKPKPSMNSGNVVSVRPHKFQTVSIYVVKTNNEESILVPQKVQVPARADRLESALNKLFEGSGSRDSAIPAGTILRMLEVKDGMAVIDMSKEFVDNFSGGSQDEALAIKAIVKTAAQFGNIEKVQILVEGRKIGTLGGHFELLEPIDTKVVSVESGDVGE